MTTGLAARGLWQTWFRWTTGEFAGFLTPALVGAVIPSPQLLVLGLLVFFAVTTPLWQPGQPPVLIALIGALGGLLMAATTAAVTGAALTRLVRTGT